MVELLESHPQIKAFDEIFDPNLSEFMRSGFKPLQVLEKVYEAYPWMSGFKLTYSQARKYDGEIFGEDDVWNKLRELKDIKVIHSVRDNGLARIISWKVGMETGAWHHYSERKLDVRVKLEVEECVEMWEFCEEREKQLDEWFSDHPLLKVRYRDLAQDVPGKMEEIQRFLGVEPRALTSRIKKRKGNWYDRDRKSVV